MVQGKGRLRRDVGDLGGPVVGDSALTLGAGVMGARRAGAGRHSLIRGCDMTEVNRTGRPLALESFAEQERRRRRAMLAQAEDDALRSAARQAAIKAERERGEREALRAIASSPAFRALRAREAQRAHQAPGKGGMLRKVVRIGGSETTLVAPTARELTALEERVKGYVTSPFLGGGR
jgi:hypothetical protein